MTCLNLHACRCFFFLTTPHPLPPTPLFSFGCLTVHILFRPVVQKKVLHIIPVRVRDAGQHVLFSFSSHYSQPWSSLWNVCWFGVCRDEAEEGPPRDGAGERLAATVGCSSRHTFGLFCAKRSRFPRVRWSALPFSSGPCLYSSVVSLLTSLVWLFFPMGLSAQFCRKSSWRSWNSQCSCWRGTFFFSLLKIFNESWDPEYYMWWSAVVEGLRQTEESGKEETTAYFRHTAIGVYFAADSFSTQTKCRPQKKGALATIKLALWSTK